MPATTAFASNSQQPPYPALYLYPLNDSFIPKHISLLHNQRVKIGRQTNAKTAPGERNGYFDSKVLSRQHAEVWEDNNKIFIKDVKSSNGTFINGERLSPEGLESDPYELKSDDIVEFGIDIVGEDNKTIIHHKVAARVVCVFTEQDVQVAARAEQHQAQQQSQQQHYRDQSSSSQSTSSLHQPNGTASSSSAAAFNFANNQGSQRRPQLAQQGIAGMGGMGGSMRPPGKSGLTFDHILSRLQGELQKSRETGAELHTLTSAMTEIHDTLGGTLPPNLPPYPQILPPVRPGQAPTQPPPQTGATQAQAQPQPQPQPQPQASQSQPSAEPQSQPQPQSTATTTTTTTSPSTTTSTSSSAAAADPGGSLTDLRAQLQETQSSLSTHVDKVRALEGMLAEQEAIRREVRALREMMERRRADEPHVREYAHHSRGYRDVDHGAGRHDGENEFRHDLKLQELQSPPGEFDWEDEDLDRERKIRARMGGGEDDDSDARSVSTVVPHELERVDEEDEDALADEGEGEGAQDRYEDMEIERGERTHGRRPEDEPYVLHPMWGQLGERDRDQHGDNSERVTEDLTGALPEPGDEADTVEGEGAGDAHPDADEAEADGESEGESDDDEASRRRRSDELGRPRTPEPSSLGMGVMGLSKLSSTRRATRSPTSASASPHSHVLSGIRGKEIEVERVLEQVGALVALTSALEAQHAAAQSTIAALESKVGALEAEVRSEGRPGSPVKAQIVQEQEREREKEREREREEGEKQDEEVPTVERIPTPEQDREREQESLTTMVMEWTKSMEGKWSSVQEDWGKERERLNHAREEWEAKARLMDSGLEKLGTLSAALQERERELRGHAEGEVLLGLNGEAVKHAGASPGVGGSANAIGLATPPSPRSLSSDSGRSRRRRRGRGRGSRSVSPDTDTDATLASEEAGHEHEHEHDHDHDHEDVVKAKVRAYAYRHGNGHAIKPRDGDEEEEEEDTVLGVRTAVRGKDGGNGAGTLATPDSSVYKLVDLESEEARAPGAGAEVGKGGYARGYTNAYHIQTAIGVLMLSVAAAAVIWRVKPET